MDGVTLLLFAVVIVGGWVSHRLWTAPLIGEHELERLGYARDAYSYSMPVAVVDTGLVTARGVELPPLSGSWTLDDVMDTLAEIDQLQVGALSGEQP